LRRSSRSIPGDLVSADVQEDAAHAQAQDQGGPAGTDEWQGQSLVGEESHRHRDVEQCLSHDQHKDPGPEDLGIFRADTSQDDGAAPKEQESRSS